MSRLPPEESDDDDDDGDEDDEGCHEGGAQDEVGGGGAVGVGVVTGVAARFALLVHAGRSRVGAVQDDGVETS